MGCVRNEMRCCSKAQRLFKDSYIRIFKQLLIFSACIISIFSTCVVPIFTEKGSVLLVKLAIS